VAVGVFVKVDVKVWVAVAVAVKVGVPVLVFVLVLVGVPVLVDVKVFMNPWGNTIPSSFFLQEMKPMDNNATPTRNRLSFLDMNPSGLQLFKMFNRCRLIPI
jgi:hypothetical protein